MKAALVVNPASGNGRTGRQWARLENQIRAGLDFAVECAMTERPGHAAELTRSFIQAGAEMIISAGGDGTHNEVLNGFFEGDGLMNPEAVLATITLGTGSDFIRTLGWEKSLIFALKKINQPQVKEVDVGLAEFEGLAGRKSRRFFMNVVDFGAGGAVVARVNRTTKALGGRISFLWGIIATLMTYQNKLITFSIDGGPERRAVLNDFIVGNGQYFGGGIRAAPLARLDDACLDVVLVGDFGLIEALLNLPRFRRGDHLDHPKVSHEQARVIEADSQERVMINLDGEYIGFLPARFELAGPRIKLVV